MLTAPTSVDSCSLPSGDSAPLVVRRIACVDEWDALAGDWNRLSGGHPFRSWEWHRAWWEHFGATRELYVLAATDATGGVCGIAPWYLDRSAGRTIRFLGDGKVCTDHISLLVDPSDAGRFVTALVDWLADAEKAISKDSWQALEFEAVAAGDDPVRRLIQGLEAAGYPLLLSESAPGYALELPRDDATFLDERSKSHRHAIRQLDRRIQSGERRFQVLRQPADLTRDAWSLFTDLHQLRRHLLGDSGCFDTPGFSNFLYTATRDLMARNMASLLFAYDHDTPMSTILLFHDRKSVYMYQNGMDLGVTERSPGTVALTLAIRWAIAQGFTRYDFLRGDEDYKRTWRAQPWPMHRYRVSSRAPWARVRHGMLAAKDYLRRMWRTGIKGDPQPSS